MYFIIVILSGLKEEIFKLKCFIRVIIHSFYFYGKIFVIGELYDIKC